MKILSISGYFAPDFMGGYGIVHRNVVESLMKKGHEIKVLTGKYRLNKIKSKKVKYEDKITRKLELIAPYPLNPYVPYRRRICVAYKNYILTKEYLKGFRPNVAMMWHNGRTTLGSMYALQDKNIPVFYWFGDMWLIAYKPYDPQNGFKSKIKSILESTILKKMTFKYLNLTYSACNSKSLRNDLLEENIPIQNRIIRQGIPQNQFRHKKEDLGIKNPVRLLYVGSLIEDKGVRTILEAMGIIKERSKDKDFVLNLVGNGQEDYISFLKKLCKEKGIESSVNFIGKIDAQEIQKFYLKNDIFIFPSIIRESFPSTPLESMISGIPLITTDSGGTKELVVHRHNSLIFPAGNAERLVDCILELVRNKKLREKISKAAYKTVKKRFSFNRFVDEIENYLLEIYSSAKT